MERLLSAKCFQEQFLFNLHTKKKNAIIYMINRWGLIYRREREWLLQILQRMEQQPLTLLQAGLLDAKPKHPPLMWPWPPRLPSATAHRAFLPCCHHGKTSDLKQTPRAREGSQAKTSYFQQCLYQRAESGSCWLSCQVSLQQPERDWYLTILVVMLVSPAPSTLF